MKKLILLTTEFTENTEGKENFGQKTPCNSVSSVVSSSSLAEGAV